MSKQQIAVVGICTSTGGPPILVEILANVPRPYPLPILLVQHISEPFIEGFATWLAGKTGQEVRIAKDGQSLSAGIWLATAGHHLSLSSSHRIRLIKKRGTDIHCPSGNPLFSSLARHFGPLAIGVQLTGMGDDGADGLLELRKAGGQTVVQDEASSMIYGMPRAAKQLGAATRQLAPTEIATVLRQICER